MRILFIIFVISLLIFLGIGMGVRYGFPLYQTITQAFFEGIQKREYKEAYQLLSSDFKKSVPFDHFQDFIEHSEYKDYQSGIWSAVQMGDTQGTMRGTITLRSGKKIPLEFFFIKEPDTIVDMTVPDDLKAAVSTVAVWKLDTIRHATVDANNHIPSEPEAVQHPIQ